MVLWPWQIVELDGKLYVWENAPSLAEWARSQAEAIYGPLDSFALDSVEVEGDEAHARVSVRPSSFAQLVDVEINGVPVDGIKQ